MGTNVTPDKLRGFLIPSKAVTKNSIWSAQSSFTQKNPRAGIPEPQQIGTNLQLKTIGEQTQDITITTETGGAAGINARYTWTDASSNEYGRDWKNILTQWDYLRFSAGAGSNSFVHSDAVESVNGTLYFVTESITATSQHIIQVLKKERGAGAVTTLATLVNANYPSTNTTAHPAIELMQDGSLVVAYFNTWIIC